MKVNKSKVEDLIYQYHWRKREADRLESRLWGSPSGIMRPMGVSQYGIEATLPKPNTNLKSHAEMEAMDAREERIYKRLQKHSEIVNAIERLEDYLEDPQHIIILDCMMDGMSYRSIADHLGMNRNKIREMKDEMLCQICQKCHFLHDLFNKKTA